MSPKSMGESSAKPAIERPGHNTNLSETALHASSLIMSLVQEAAMLAPCAELKQAAAVALVIFDTIQAVKDNKQAYKRLGDDSAGLIVAIWRSYKKAENPKEWLSADIQEILVELTHTLDHICSFVREKLARNKALRVIYSRADVGKIAEYRENLNSAMQKFELQSHINIDLKLGKLSDQIRYRNGEDIKRVLEISAREARDLEETETRIHEQELKVGKKNSTPEYLKQHEVDYQAEDEREHSEELKERKKDNLKDRQSELERLRAAVRAVETANRLKREEEDEIAELRRTIAAGRRSITPQVQPSKDKTSSTQEDDSELEEDEKERRRKKEDELGRKTNNPHRSPKRPHRASETYTDDEKELHRISKTRTAQRKLSSSPLHFEETEEDLSTDEEKSPPAKKGPKVSRKPQIPPGSLPREVDDLMAQFQGFGTPLGSARSSPHGSRSGSPMYYSPYGSPLPPSMPPNSYGYGYGYGYGGGVPGTIVNTGVGNVTNTIVSNVGNDNSVQKVYRVPRNQRTLRDERN